MRNLPIVLGLLAVAFMGRVVGQLVVALYAPHWLPAMEEWYSGLVPYPILLLSQVAILALQARVSADLWRGKGFFSVRHPPLGIGLRWFSFIYVAVMIFRYALTMILFSERRWFGGTIPILFHCVLAAFLYVWSRFHTQRPLQERPAGP